MKKVPFAAALAAVFCCTPALVWGQMDLHAGAALSLSRDYYSAQAENQEGTSFLRRESSSALILETGFDWGILYGGIDFFLLGKETVKTSLTEESSPLNGYSSTEFLAGIMGLYPWLQGERWSFSPGLGIEYAQPLERTIHGEDVLEGLEKTFDLSLYTGGRITRRFSGDSPWRIFFLLQGGANLFPHPSEAEAVDRKGFEILLRLSGGLSYRYLQL